jgi:hypothetical protein
MEALRAGTISGRQRAIDSGYRAIFAHTNEARVRRREI